MRLEASGELAVAGDHQLARTLQIHPLIACTPW
jgi:hypothetical protein